MMDNGTPIYSRPTAEGGWWLMLLEKAFAKLNGDY